MSKNRRKELKKLTARLIEEGIEPEDVIELCSIVSKKFGDELTIEEGSTVFEMLYAA
jgi:predicted transcriptional regulator